MYKGIFTAIVTPFTKEDKIDYEALVAILKLQIDAKIAGVVIAGSTGEYLSLDLKEYQDLLAFVINYLRSHSKEMKIIAAATDKNTKSTIEVAKVAQSLGVDAIMSAVPFYTKPNQQGIIEHFKTLSEKIDLPIILYSVPSRVGSDFTLRTIIELSQIKNIIGIKDASGNLFRTLQLKKHVQSDFVLLAGDDQTHLAFYAQGGDGCISVASNLVPKIMQKIYQLFLQNDFAAALKLNLELCPLYELLNSDTNPLVIKYALGSNQICENIVRLPLVPLINLKETEVMREIFDMSQKL